MLEALLLPVIAALPSAVIAALDAAIYTTKQNRLSRVTKVARVVSPPIMTLIVMVSPTITVLSSYIS